MTPEAQRLAIAKACGWNIHHAHRLCSVPNAQGTRWQGLLFDPLQDLNAMHAAVSTLTREQYDAEEGFTFHLACVVHGEDAVDVGWNFYELQEATAAQRAEAFLRTLNLWTNE